MSKIEIPFFNANQGSLNAAATSGSNPWVDGLFYEAQWGKSIRIAFGVEKPVYSYYFLKPADIRLLNRSPLQRAEARTWSGVGSQKGLAGVSEALAATFQEAYKAISDVCLLEFKRQTRPEKASIWIANAYFKNRGEEEGNPGSGMVLGSHQGLINQRTGRQAQLPLLQTLNAFFSEAAEVNGRLGKGYGTFSTIIHEAGHGVGQSHPHDSGLGGSMSGVFPGLVPVDSFGRFGTGLWGLTQTPFTIMSYKRGYTNKTITSSDQASVDNATTPMALDVAALQIKYGTNRTTRTEATTYLLNPKTWTCIYDAGGDDWIRVASPAEDGQQVRNSYINLRPAEMNAIRPHSGEPMEAYAFQLGSTVDLAINTLISAQTSMIGNPLGMGYVLASKTARVFDGRLPEDVEESLISRLTVFGERLRSLEQESVNMLQLLTSMKQYIDAYNFEDLLELGVQKTKRAIPDLATLSDRDVALILEILVESGSFAEAIEKFYLDSFTQPSGPDSYMADLARLHAEQEQLLERSSRGIGGYPSYLEGLNGGLTIAAGVLIENAEGGAGNDQIVGNAENNTLLGNEGDDVLEGYFGADRLTGGPGADVFAYAYPGDSPANPQSRDTITDFAPDDRVSLKQLRTSLSRDASALSSILDTDYQFRFLGDAAFSGRAGDVRFAAGALAIDLDGDSSADMAIDLPGVTSIAASHLIL